MGDKQPGDLGSAGAAVGPRSRGRAHRIDIGRAGSDGGGDGPGVVGEQPVLKPGESFEYTSGAPLSTPSGFMGGTYRMESEDGQAFDVEIPTFSLDSPFQSRALN